MRKKSFLLLAIAVAILFSCKKEKNIKTESYTLEDRYALSSDTTKGTLEISIQSELPVEYKNHQVLTEIRNHIVESLFGEKYVQISNANLLQQFSEDMKTEYRDNNLPFINDRIGTGKGFAFNNDYEMESFSLMSDENIYSYGANIYVNTGGAHGLYTRLYFNYDLKSGKVIKQNDIFTQEGLNKLPDMIKKNIIHFDSDINSTEDLNERYWVNEIKPNDNFFISTDGITYVFNAYEIAPYTEGDTEVLLTFEELKPIIKENSILSYLIK